MRIGIIGSGNIGGTAARLFTEAGHEVALSHSGSPDSLRDQVAQFGPRACAMTVDEAAQFGEVVLLALPWRNRDALPASKLRDRIVIDATNPYRPDGTLYDLGDSTSSEEVEKALPGARLVKAFNHLFARDLATRGRREFPLSERTVLFVAGDDEDARRVVFGLIADIGFAAVDTGPLREGGRLMQPGSPIYTRPLRASEVPAVLGLDNGGEASATPRTESAKPDDS